MSSLTQDQLEQAVLVHLFERANEGLDRAKSAEVAAGVGAPEPRVAMALRTLDDRNLVRAAHNYMYGSSYEISEAGYRRVEASHGPSDKVSEEYERLFQQLVPASDRTVAPSHNSPDYVHAIEKVEEAQKLIASSNQLPEDEKEDALLHIEAGLSIVKRARQFAIGAVRYLILDRLKAAFEGAIEDAFKVVIIGAFLAFAAVLVAML
jgi:hypothetical protein